MAASRFTTEQHLADVLSRFDDAPNQRLAEISRAAVRHLLAFVEEVELTREEWLAGIQMLTETGKMCSDERQEFILLSDTLGVSMLVEMINHSATDGTTEPTVFGPFHVENAPHKQMGESIVIDPTVTDEKITFSGRVLDLANNPIQGATMEVWQTASNGLYDVQDREQTPMNLRGTFETGKDGMYEFESVRPCAYSIPGDGPVGRWLAGTGRHNWRPGHVHFVVSAPSYKTVITHLFDADSNYLDSDAVFGVRDSLIVDMNDANCEYDFVLDDSAD